MTAAQPVAALTALPLAAIVLAACADQPPHPAPDTADTDVCGPVEEPPRQSGSHLLGDQQPPVAYSSTPPTSGWHASGAFDITVQPPDDPLPEPQQVSVLEAGGVVVAYRDIGDSNAPGWNNMSERTTRAPSPSPPTKSSSQDRSPSPHGARCKAAKVSTLPHSTRSLPPTLQTTPMTPAHIHRGPIEDDGQGEQPR